MDDGVLAGNRPAVLRAVQLIEELGPALGIHINFSKCELFSRTGNASFLHNRQCPADLLVTGWDRGRPAAMDITVTSPLTPIILGESCQVVGEVDLC